MKQQIRDYLLNEEDADSETRLLYFDLETISDDDFEE